MDRGKHPSRRQLRHRVEVKAKRLSEKLFAEAAAANFTNFETEEERERVTPLVLAAVTPHIVWNLWLVAPRY